MAKIGLKNLHYAPMTKDDATTPTYGAVVAVPGLVTANITPNGQMATLYADNVAAEAAGALGTVAVELEMNELPLEMIAALLGHTVTKGVMEAKESDVAPYVALMFQGDFVKDGQTYTEYVKLFKVKFNEPAEGFETKKDTVNFQTGKISGTACVRLDGKWKSIAKSNATDYEDVSATWYATV